MLDFIHEENPLPDADAIMANRDYLATLAQQFKDVETSAQELRGLLRNYAATLKNEGLQRQADTLGTWLGMNCEGLGVATRALSLGAPWLNELQQRMQCALDDLAAIKNRPDANPEQADAQELMRIWSEINSALDSMETLFSVPVMRQAELLHAGQA